MEQRKHETNCFEDCLTVLVRFGDGEAKCKILFKFNFSLEGIIQVKFLKDIRLMMMMLILWSCPRIAWRSLQSQASKRLVYKHLIKIYSYTVYLASRRHSSSSTSNSTIFISVSNVNIYIRRYFSFIMSDI